MTTSDDSSWLSRKTWLTLAGGSALLAGAFLLRPGSEEKPRPIPGSPVTFVTQKKNITAAQKVFRETARELIANLTTPGPHYNLDRQALRTRVREQVTIALNDKPVVVRLTDADTGIEEGDDEKTVALKVQERALQLSQKRVANVTDLIVQLIEDDPEHPANADIAQRVKAIQLNPTAELEGMRLLLAEMAGVNERIQKIIRERKLRHGPYFKAPSAEEVFSDFIAEAKEFPYTAFCAGEIKGTCLHLQDIADIGDHDQELAKEATTLVKRYEAEARCFRVAAQKKEAQALQKRGHTLDDLASPGYSGPGRAP